MLIKRRPTLRVTSAPPSSAEAWDSGRLARYSAVRLVVPSSQSSSSSVQVATTSSPLIVVLLRGHVPNEWHVLALLAAAVGHANGPGLPSTPTAACPFFFKRALARLMALGCLGAVRAAERVLLFPILLRECAFTQLQGQGQLLAPQLPLQLPRTLLRSRR